MYVDSSAGWMQPRGALNGLGDAPTRPRHNGLAGGRRRCPPKEGWSFHFGQECFDNTDGIGRARDGTMLRSRIDTYLTTQSAPHGSLWDRFDVPEPPGTTP